MAIINQTETKSSITFFLNNATEQSIQIDIENYFFGRGYKVHKQAGYTTTYQKGSRVLRILLGAFVTFHQQKVSITPSDNGSTKVEIDRTSSGMSGGLLGMNAVRKEFKKVREELTSLFEFGN
jgi:hypothetical protein